MLCAKKANEVNDLSCQSTERRLEFKTLEVESEI